MVVASVMETGKGETWDSEQKTLQQAVLECVRKCERLRLWRLDRNRVAVLVAGRMVP